ncbi:hypothetical protein VSX64_24680 [Aurantimonas sp. C2-6-R+9]|uniref:hypothetical protein n=1 Tax=unclassified Aurantimonas TaxID=2638230 RepID=UPI002E180F8C|nr:MULTISPECIES: hypothetical protein [unclassified Aurantimonas]MEC5293718.1 hypothetical protein [Aurantimonas sp. C2-3-R2]MEC5383904.1 hypothetical protein [Aurantimonas sp. C2-6-R+9]MEC5414766.1 hypothetical protein [Aurantimonas sp. C2-4-R8]
MLKSIKNKMTLLGVLVFLLVSGTAATGFWMTGQLRDGLEETLRSSQVLRNHMQADMMHDALRSDVLASVLAADPSANIDLETVKADVAEHTGIFYQAIAENGELAQDPEIRKSLDDVKVPMEEYTALAVDLTTLAARNPTAAMSRMGVFQEQFSILESAMAHVAEVIESEAVAASQRATASAAIGRNLMGTAVGIGTLFALGTPIQELASDMQQLVEGECPGLC